MSNVNGELIEIRELIKDYPIGGGSFRALQDINLDIGRQEFTGLVGPSGSGKTTLLNVIGSLDSPTQGQAIVLGHDIKTLDHKKAAQLRNHHIGFIFQTFNLLPVYTVYENVELPLLLLKKSQEERRKLVMQALEHVRLLDKIHSKPAQLSGGQSQRVAIARAIVKQPELVLADEPTANLDAENSFHILDIMTELNKDLGTTFVFATHDEKVIKYLRRIISLKDGKIDKDRIVIPSGQKEEDVPC